mmetsp:Transcript_58435/g.162901  ORF Transcript_58435/g.162901 Transcript_58435/m.162901 type:complete len:295 (-) Transcript_58435:1379-2263(-)
MPHERFVEEGCRQLPCVFSGDHPKEVPGADSARVACQWVIVAERPASDVLERACTTKVRDHALNASGDAALGSTCVEGGLDEVMHHHTEVTHFLLHVQPDAVQAWAANRQVLVWRDEPLLLIVVVPSVSTGGRPSTITTKVHELGTSAQGQGAWVRAIARIESLDGLALRHVKWAGFVGNHFLGPATPLRKHVEHFFEGPRLRAVVEAFHCRTAVGQYIGKAEVLNLTCFGHELLVFLPHDLRNGLRKRGRPASVLRIQLQIGVARHDRERKRILVVRRVFPQLGKEIIEARWH